MAGSIPPKTGSALQFKIPHIMHNSSFHPSKTITMVIQSEGLSDLVGLFEESPVNENATSPPCSDDEASVSSNESSSSNSTGSVGSTASHSNNTMPLRSSVPSEAHLRALAKAGKEQHGSSSTGKEYRTLVAEYEAYSISVHGDKRIIAKRVFTWLTYTAHRP